MTHLTNKLPIGAEPTCPRDRHSRKLERSQGHRSLEGMMKTFVNTIHPTTNMAGQEIGNT